MKKNIYLVSYPRSGQHYTQRLIERVTGEDNYCELYKCRVDDCPGKNLPVGARSPCPAGRRVQKTHDFDLKFPIESNVLYAVLLRTPMFSLASYYEHSTKAGKGVKVRGEVMQDTPEAWAEFVAEKAIYWRDLVEKWARAAEAQDNIRLVRYEDITTSSNAIRGFFDFYFPDASPDSVDYISRKQIEAIERGNAGGRSLSNFRYPVDEAIIAARRAIPSQTLSLLNYVDVV